MLMQTLLVRYNFVTDPILDLKHTDVNNTLVRYVGGTAGGWVMAWKHWY